MKLLNVEFGAFAHSAPHDRAAVMMDLQHMPFGFLPRVSKYSLKDHRHIGHQIDWIVMHHHLPGDIQFLFGLGALFDRWIGGGGTGILKSGDRPHRSAPRLKPDTPSLADHLKRLTYAAPTSNHRAAENSCLRRSHLPGLPFRSIIKSVQM
jgi:hypothetical protein